MMAILHEQEPEADHAAWERHVRMAETPAKHSVALSFFDGETLILIAGLTIFNPYCGEVWMVKAKGWERYRYTLAVLTGKTLDWFQTHHGLKRLQADVVAGDGTARRYLEHFGFQCEGKKACFDALGRDVLMMARVRA